MNSTFRYGCTTWILCLLSIQIASQEPLSAEITYPFSLTCQDGAIDLTISGGFSPYEVQWYKNGQPFGDPVMSINLMSGKSQVDILKVDILDGNTTVYVTKDYIGLYERNGIVKRLSFKRKFIGLGFIDFSNNLDFAIQDSYLLTLHSHKYCLNCNMMDYQISPWLFRYEIIDLSLNDSKLEKLGILSKPVISSINIENKDEVSRSGYAIEYAFVYTGEDILLIFITGYNIYIYKSIENIALNQWELIGESRLYMNYRNFVVYYDDGKIIFDDMYKGRFEAIINEGIHIKYLSADSLNIVPIYLHQDKKYYKLKRSIVNKMLDQDNPIDYIISQIRQENYHE